MLVYHVNSIGAATRCGAARAGKRGGDQMRGQIRLTSCAVMGYEQRLNVGNDRRFELGAGPGFDAIGALHPSSVICSILSLSTRQP